jgi:hypothetical protein
LFQHPRKKPLDASRADAIYVEGDDAHAQSLPEIALWRIPLDEDASRVGCQRGPSGYPTFYEMYEFYYLTYILNNGINPLNI